MNSSSHTASAPPRKRKAQELEDEDGTLAVAPPKRLDASITWDVQARDMSHRMFCTKFVAIMDTAIESQKWNVDIQKKCMELMGKLRLSDFSSKAISNHKLAKQFLEDPSFIIIMMLKLLYPLDKMKRCNFLLSAVAREYPGWDYSKERYPPSKYPTSRPAEKKLETLRVSIENMNKLIEDIRSTADEIKNMLQDIAATEHGNLTEMNIKNWINDATGETKSLTTSDIKVINNLLRRLAHHCVWMAKRLELLENKVRLSSQARSSIHEVKKEAKSS